MHLFMQQMRGGGGVSIPFKFMNRLKKKKE